MSKIESLLLINELGGIATSSELRKIAKERSARVTGDISVFLRRLKNDGYIETDLIDRRTKRVRGFTYKITEEGKKYILTLDKRSF